MSPMSAARHRRGGSAGQERSKDGGGRGVSKSQPLEWMLSCVSGGPWTGGSQGSGGSGREVRNECCCSRVRVCMSRPPAAAVPLRPQCRCDRHRSTGAILLPPLFWAAGRCSCFMLYFQHYLVGRLISQADGSPTTILEYCYSSSSTWEIGSPVELICRWSRSCWGSGDELPVPRLRSRSAAAVRRGHGGGGPSSSIDRWMPMRRLPACFVPILTEATLTKQLPRGGWIVDRSMYVCTEKIRFLFSAGCCGPKFIYKQQVKCLCKLF